MVVEDKIKQITAEKDWVDDKKLNEKMTLNEALLQRDIAASERDELRKQLSELEDAVKEIKAAELEVFNRVEAIAAREVNKIKSAFSQINVPLKNAAFILILLPTAKEGFGRRSVYPGFNFQIAG